jgi:hypothetical protein
LETSTKSKDSHRRGRSMRKKKITMAAKRYRLLKKCMTQIQHAHQRATAEGIPDAVAFVINCKDTLGRRFCSVLNSEADDPDRFPTGTRRPNPALLRCDGFRFDDAKRAAERLFPPLPAFNAPPPAHQILVVVVSEGVEACCIPAAVPAARTNHEPAEFDASHTAGHGSDAPQQVSRGRRLDAQHCEGGVRHRFRLESGPPSETALTENGA